MILRRALKAVYVRSARALGVERRLLERIRRNGHTVVVNLHRVSPERNDFYQPIHPDLFDGLLRFLKEHFWITTFGELLDAPERSRPAAVISFDDGFKDFVEHAVPILAAQGVRANQNVVPRCVLTGERPWTQRLNDFLGAAPPGLLRELRLPGAPPPPTNGGADKRARFGAALGAYLIGMRPTARASAWGHIERLMARADGYPTTKMMSISDVREVARVHEVGAHSDTHEPMDLETIDGFAADLERCATFFRDHLASPMTVYAFPFGRSRPEQVDRALRWPGMRAVLLVGDRYAGRGPVFPRFNIGATTAAELRLEALGRRAGAL